MLEKQGWFVNFQPQHCELDGSVTLGDTALTSFTAISDVRGEWVQGVMGQSQPISQWIVVFAHPEVDGPRIVDPAMY